MKIYRFGPAAIAVLVLVPLVRASQPWDTAFQSDVRAILDAASKITPADQPEIVVLLEDHRYTIHSDGRIDTVIRKIYRIEQQDAVEDWSSIEQPYQPWYQQTPELKARVIGKDGSIRWLDPKTIADAPARQFDATIFSDERVLRAPLPGVIPGSIIEFEVTLHDRLPLLDAGVVQRVVIPGGVPVERFHILIEADSGVKLNTASQLIPDNALRRSESGKATRVECELGPIAKKSHFEWNLPSSTADSPYLSFSTGASWQAIAARYENIVNDRLRNADLKPLLEGIGLEGKPMEVGSRLVARLHQRVRYTGVEFAEAAIVPGTPAETIQRGYGDCKDKATLLVAMLRAAGLRADVALLDAGMGLDVDRELPGMGMFDHAIVYVASDPPLWIDATASDMRVGQLPSADRGRFVLIANRGSNGLVQTPVAEPQQNRERSTIEVRMSELGFATLQISEELDGGSSEAGARAAYGSEEKKSKENVESWTKRAFAAKSLGKYESMRRDDMSGPFRMTLEAVDAKIAPTGLEDAAVALTPWTLFEKLPYALTSEPAEDAKDPKPREQDFVVNEPYQTELRYIIRPPVLFKAAKLPASAEVKLGPATFSKHFEAQADGTIEVVYRFDSGKPRMTASEFSEFRAALRRLGGRTPELISFAPETAEYVALGQASKAISLLRERVGADPNNAMVHIRLSNVLMSAGLGDAALQEAKAAVDRDAKSVYGWTILGMAFERDSFGRLRQGDWNPGEAEKALRKAAELDPEKGAWFELAILFEYNAQGWRYGTGARMDEAIAIYRDLAKKPQHDANVDLNLAVALMQTGRFGEADEILKKLSGETVQLLLDCITAIDESPARVIVKSQAAYPDNRQRATHLAQVSQTLVQIRRYDAATVLMNAAARTLNASELQTRAELLGKLKHWQDCVLPENDPRSPVQRLLLDGFRNTLTPQSIRPLVSKRLTEPVSEFDLQKIRATAAKVRGSLSSAGFEEETLVDFIASLLELEKTGDDEHGYRIRAYSPGTASTFSLYVTREDGAYRILGGPLTGLEGVAALILESLERNEIKGAQAWLDRVVSDAEAGSDGTGRPAIVGLWSGVKDETRGPAAIRVAAAALLGAGTGSKTALSALEEARLKAPTPLEKSQVDKAICETLLAAKRWTDLMVSARLLETSKILHEEGFRYFIKGATNARKWKELESEALSALASNPDHLIAMRAMVLAKSRQGDAAGAAEWVKKMTASKFAGRDEQIFAAWIAMGQGQADHDVLSRLKQSAPRGVADGEYLLTVALMEAMLGMTDDAQPSLAQGTAGEALDALPAVAWAVHGKICSNYGYSECANISLEKARREAELMQGNYDSWLVAALGTKR